MSNHVDFKVWNWRGLILKHGPENPTYRHVLLTLSCYMDDAGQSCFPSYDTLQEATQLGRSTLAKYLKKARQDGWIEVRKHGYGGQKWARNEYTAALPEAVKKAVREVNHVDEGSSPAGQRQFASRTKAVREVNSNSSVNSTSNSSESSARPRETDDQVPTPTRRADPTDDATGDPVAIYRHHLTEWLEVNNRRASSSVPIRYQELIRAAVTDTQAWDAHLVRWQQSGYRMPNVPSILDAYEEAQMHAATMTDDAWLSSPERWAVK